MIEQLTQDEVLAIFREAGALLEGHFIFTSGRHGTHFIQAARVLQYPRHAEALCEALADPFVGEGIDAVVGPAVGGIILAYETARKLDCRALFTERDEQGAMTLKRGFTLKPDTRVLVVEDITTTGGSAKKTIAHLRQRGAHVVGVGALIDRSKGEARFDCRFECLARLDLCSWDPADCELCREGIPLVEPDDLIG